MGSGEISARLWIKCVYGFVCFPRVCVFFRRSSRGTPPTLPLPLRKHIASHPKWQMLENQWLFTEESTPRGRRGDVYRSRDSRIVSLPRSPPPVCCLSNCCAVQTSCSSPRLLRGSHRGVGPRDASKRFKRHFAVRRKTAF